MTGMISSGLAFVAGAVCYASLGVLRSGGAAAVRDRKPKRQTATRTTPAARHSAGPSLIYWNDKYSLGVPPMDRQHRRLVDLINRLFVCMNQGADMSEMKGVMDELIDYTQRHFADEERLMAKYGYPTLTAHRLKHEKLVAEVAEMYREFDSRGKTIVSLKLMRFLKQWLLEHILVEDRKYAGHILAKRADAHRAVRRV